MNKTTQLAISLVAVALLLSATANSQDANALVEDSFEKGGTTPQDWKSGAKVPGVRYRYDKRRGKTGERSLSLQKTAKRYFPIAQWERTFPSRGRFSALRVTTHVRAVKATKAIVDVVFLDSAGEMMSHEWASYIGAKEANDPPANHDWKEYSGVVTIPDGTKQIMLALQIYGPGKVWFDDIKAEFVTKPNSVSGNSVAAENNAATVDQAVPENAVEITVGEGVGHYLLVPPKGDQPPATGHGLVVALAGGNGSADFHPFVRRIRDNSLSDDFAIAQPIAKKWTADQVVVWPTATDTTAEVKHTTEELITAVIDHVGETTVIDRKRVYILAWSSGGPAAYASLLQKESPVTGGLIAMSVFKPNRLPPVVNAKGRSIYLLHSPQDLVCPYRLAVHAHNALAEAGVRATLFDYQGGHGWRGDVFGNIRRGIEWLEQSN